MAEYRGAATGTGLPPLFGAARPFGDDQLRAMYPSRGPFEAQWRRAVDALVAAQAIRPEDAAAMHQRVEGVRLPTDEAP